MTTILAYALTMASGPPHLFAAISSPCLVVRRLVLYLEHRKTKLTFEMLGVTAATSISCRTAVSGRTMGSVSPAASRSYALSATVFGRLTLRVRAAEQSTSVRLPPRSEVPGVRGAVPRTSCGDKASNSKGRPCATRFRFRRSPKAARDIASSAIATSTIRRPVARSPRPV